MQNGGVQIMHGADAVHGVHAHLIGAAVGRAAPRAAAGQPDGKSLGMMVAAIATGRVRRAAEFAGPKHQRFIQETTLFQILDKSGNGLIGIEGVLLVALLQIAVLIPGARAPFLVRRADLKRMQPRAVIIDVAIDQGGCVETARPTTHSHPTYIVDDVVHYCVTNMPGAVGRTSTYALTNVTLPYVLQLAKKGLDRAVRDNRALAEGVNVRQGKVTNPAVAATFGLECVPVH